MSPVANVWIVRTTDVHGARDARAVRVRVSRLKQQAIFEDTVVARAVQIYIDNETS